ncbi:MAG: amidohydrolase family protein [Anaerolineae bacterium]
MPIIDFHNHVYPPEYIEALHVGPSAYRVTFDSDNNPILHSPGDYNIAVPGHRLMDVRADVLDADGVDMQIISLTAPGTLLETPARGVELAQLVNNAFAGIQRDYPKRFAALATLPLHAPEASVAELERAVGQLGLKGATLFGNVNGVALSDKRFWPLYEVANEMSLTFFIHPTYPVGVEAMLDYMLMPLVGFLADTTLAAASLVFSGVAERFPNVRWVLGHLGGTIPYLAERLDRGFEAYDVCRQNISRLPSEILREKFYYDTVNFDLRALKLAIEFAGADHVVAGSDYPHLIGSIPKMVSSINALDIAEAERQAILGGNTIRLLGLSTVAA